MEKLTSERVAWVVDPTIEDPGYMFHYSLRQFGESLFVIYYQGLYSKIK